MADYRHIYEARAADYHRLISAEDAAGAVARWLGEAVGGEGGVALDVGAGTGRVAAMVAAVRPSARLVCTDAEGAMLEELVRRWPTDLAPVPEVLVADYRALPMPAAHFDVVTAGWALGHLTGFHPDTWPDEARRALDELARVTRPGGVIAILETLGTGAATPAAPRDSLADLYALFEARGFARTVLRTDYRFASRAEAEALTGFFFGPRVRDALVDAPDGAATLIEWTGAWRRAS